ncbi:Lysosomal-trafficking regulator-like, partial [Phytophthora palmivora]
MNATKGRNQVGRVRFKDEERNKTNQPVPAYKTRLVATKPDLNSELEIQRRQPARRIEPSGKAEFGDTQPSSQGDEVELNASRAPSADGIDPAVAQATRRRRIDETRERARESTPRPTG